VINSVYSIQTLLAIASEELHTHSPTAQLDAEVLLAHVLQVTRTYLRTWPDRGVDLSNVYHYQRLIKRRVAGEPIAYITGQQEFWSLLLHVTPATLIPRPETEILVQAVLDVAAKTACRVVDVGTGSGAIACALASERPGWDIVGLDVSRAALHIAQSNADTLGLKQLRWLQSEWLAAIASQSCDVIVSNPPYIAHADPHLSQGDVRFEPRSALVGGKDGLVAIRLLSEQAQRCLKPGGWLLLEHGYDQGPAVYDILHLANFKTISVQNDLAGYDRVTRACFG